MSSFQIENLLLTAELKSIVKEKLESYIVFTDKIKMLFSLNSQFDTFNDITKRRRANFCSRGNVNRSCFYKRGCSR
jgi:hypothetical protein